MVLSVPLVGGADETMSAVVIGGGLAGAATAYRLASAGQPVVVLERDPEPADKVCGEFLSAEAVRCLTELGIDLPRLGAVSIDRVRLLTPEHDATAELPFRAASLSRRVLDEALLERTRSVGASVRRGFSVTELEARESGSFAALSRDDQVVGDTVFLATGKHDLRGHRRPEGHHDDLIGFKLHYQLAPAQREALEGTVELIAFHGGYAGLQLIEDGWANLCFVVGQRRFRELGGRFDAVLGAMCDEVEPFARRLDGSKPRWSKPLALSNIPYGLLPRPAGPLWPLGDQAVVVPSFSGDGMSMALHSAGLAARHYLKGRSSEAYTRHLWWHVAGQVAVATAVSRAIVDPRAQRGLGAAASRWPGLMSAVARATRISNRALDQSLRSATA